MKKLTALNTAYLIKAGHDLLFQEIQEWETDLSFFQNEMNFFKKLLSRTFLRVTNKGGTEALDKLKNKVEFSLTIKCQALLGKVRQHEEHLLKIEEDLIQKPDDQVIEEHSDLKVDVNRFVTEMRIFKIELFKAVENIIHSEREIVLEGYNDGNISL
jgi:hypothetical protein